MEGRHSGVLLLRCVLLSGVAAWGFYFAATFRTMGWGYDDWAGSLLASLGIISLYALPIALLPLIGLSWRRQGLVIAALAILCVFSVELFARGQEYLLVHRLGANPTRQYTETRWWPFERHSIGFVNGEWWGCD